MPAMTTPIMRTRPQRGKNMSESSSAFESHPGRTVPVLPSPFRVCRATTRDDTAIDIVIDARAANPL